MKKAKDIMSKTGKWLLVFGILFSQLSLPISVLADELTQEEEIKTEEIKEEVTEEKDKLQPVEETEKQSELSEEKNTLEDDNTTEPADTALEEPITPEEPIISDSITIEWKENKCIIKSMEDSPVTVEEILEKVEDLEKIINLEEEEIDLTQLDLEVYNDFKLMRLDDENIYKIIILGDYNNDGIVNEDDQSEMLEKLLNDEELQVEIDVVDVNEDGEFNILDITHPIFTEGTWENNKESTDELSISMFGNETYLGEEVKVNFYIEGFYQYSLKGIEGTLNYDKELLELTKIEVNGEVQDIEDLENAHFAYLLEDYQSEDSLITLTFFAKKIGVANVSIEDIIASIGGTAPKINATKISTSVEILEYGKGGDIEPIEPTEPEKPSTPLPVETVKEENSNGEVQSTPPAVVQTNKTVQYVALSTDNYIKSLTITGYDIDFDMNKLEYSITVKNSVTSLDLNVVLNDENASYYVEGNKDFKVGENTVNIIVKSESGSTRTYTIKVNKEKTKQETTDEKDEETTNNSSKTVIIILIILVIIGLIYVIFKDDEEDQKETKKDSKKESKK